MSIERAVDKPPSFTERIDFDTEAGGVTAWTTPHFAELQELSGLPNPDPVLSLWKVEPSRRNATIGGSEIAAVIGGDKWKTNVQVFAEKAGLEAPFEGNEFTEWGSALEDVVIRFWAERHAEADELVVQPRFWWPDHQVITEGTWRPVGGSPYHSATPDAIAYQPGRLRSVQVKTVNHYAADDYRRADVPISTLAQCSWEAASIGATEWLHLAVVGGAPPIAVEDEVDPDVVSGLVAAVDRFFQCVATRVAPALIDHGHREAVNSLAVYDADGSDIHLEEMEDRFPGICAVVAAIPDLQSNEKAAGRNTALSKTRLREAMSAAGAERAFLGGHLVATLKKATEIDVDALKERYPEEWAEANQRARDAATPSASMVKAVSGEAWANCRRHVPGNPTLSIKAPKATTSDRVAA